MKLINIVSIRLGEKASLNEGNIELFKDSKGTEYSKQGLISLINNAGVTVSLETPEGTTRVLEAVGNKYIRAVGNSDSSDNLLLLPRF